MPERFASAVPVKPGRGDEAVDRPADDLFEKLLPFGDASGGLSARQAQELAFARGHELGAYPVCGAGMLGFVPMGEPMKEYLDALIGPAAQARGEGRAGDDRGIAPVVRNDQHRQALTDMWPQQIDQPVDLAFEARRHVVDRRK